MALPPQQGMDPSMMMAQGGGMPPEAGGMMPPEMGGMQPPPQPEMMPQQPPGMMPDEPGEAEEDMMDNYLDYARMEANLAKGLKKKKNKNGTLVLEELADKVYDGWQADELSREPWMRANKEWMKLALLIREGKSFPWPNASNVKYPLLATAAMQFSARAYPALVPSDGKVVKSKVLPTDPTGELLKKGSELAKHMSYQVMYKIPNWEEDMDKLLMSIAISGLCFKEIYHSSTQETHISQLVYPEDLCINYHAKSVEKAYRKTRILKYTDNEIYEKVSNDEEFLDIEYGEPSTEEVNAGQKVKSVEMEAAAVDSSTPHVFLAQHTFHDLDGDGYEEPYIVTIHRDTKKVVRIIARWDEDGVKRDGKDKIYRIEPIEYFQDFPFIPNPDGSIYALGFGVLLGPLNISVNTLINQLIDGGTLSNMPSGFIAKGLRLKMGQTPVQPGEWRAVNATGDDLGRGFFPLPVKEPSAVLMNLLQMLITAGNQLASIAEIFVGKMPGQNTPATTTQETVKQGMAVFTAIYKRIYRSLDREFKKLHRLNRVTPNLVAEEAGKLGLSIQGSDYSDDTLIVPGGDPTGDSESTKMAKISSVGGLLQFGTIDVMEFTKWNLEANEVPNKEKMIKQPSPPPPDPKLQQIQQQSQLDAQSKQTDMELKKMEFAEKQKDRELERQHKEKMFQLEYDAKMQELGLKKEEMAMKAQAQQQDLQIQAVTKAQDAHYGQIGHQQKLQQNEQSFAQKQKQAAVAKKNEPKGSKP